MLATAYIQHEVTDSRLHHISVKLEGTCATLMISYAVLSQAVFARVDK